MDDFSCLAQDKLDAQKKTYGYIEGDEAKRQAFGEQLAVVPGSQRVDVDEAGMDNRDVYGYGWNERGERIHALKTGRRAGRVNMIAAWCARHLLAPFTVDGACNRIGFETWVATCLVPVLQPGQVVILDNSTFHKGGRIQQLPIASGRSTPIFAPLFARPQQNRELLVLPQKSRSQVFGSV